MAEVVLELEADLLDELQSAALDRGFDGRGAYIRWVLEHHAALDPPAGDPAADLGQSSEPSLDPEADESNVVVPEDTTGADDDDVARALEEIEDELDEDDEE
ncbi:hypothetical protein [Halococcoides cellulosivorans]|uniref:Uncharacterized protein n=1 Tax=Halococcoides cellulosivorans TaxID=1679096 RepID=A0A2R4WZ53_9EURY|nr:hypothetical protein [Halococcoides cellulosivorans]AWB26804.1 hypothetical protein HARCEL1_03270 [Halococcoides cellulosivorans]